MTVFKGSDKECIHNVSVMITNNCPRVTVISLSNVFCLQVLQSVARLLVEGIRLDVL